MRIEDRPHPPRRVIVVDDEEPGRVNLRFALAEHPRWQLLAEVSTVAAARALLATQKVELILLDIHLPEENGLTLAREVCRLPQPPLIVFVTAFDAHAIEAFEVHALDYLLKPIDDARLAGALTRADAMLAQRQRAAHGEAVRRYFAEQDRADAAPAFWSQVHVRSVGCIERIALDQVLWTASAGNYVELHLRERTVLYRIPIGRLEAHLDPREFVRTHRKFIARVDQCVALSKLPDGGHSLTLRCGQALPVSDQYLQAVRARIGTR